MADLRMNGGGTITFSARELRIVLKSLAAFAGLPGIRPVDVPGGESETTEAEALNIRILKQQAAALEEQQKAAKRALDGAIAAAQSGREGENEGEEDATGNVRTAELDPVLLAERSKSVKRPADDDAREARGNRRTATTR